jgi:hypothetical protein
MSIKENINRKIVLKKLRENGSKKDKEALDLSKKSRKLKMNSKQFRIINKQAKNLR